MWIKKLLSLLIFAIFACNGSYTHATPQDSTTVAAWRGTSLSLIEFEAAYFLFWQGTSAPDSPALRQQAALTMLEQKLIALKGREQGITNLPVIQQKLARDARLFIRTQYLENEVASQVELPTEAEVDEAMLRQKKRYYVRQLFSLTEPGIDSLAKRLAAGEPFPALAEATLPDPELAKKGGTLGWLAWGETDLPVEDLLFELEAGDTSPPVESLMGWHIFQVDSVEQYITFGQPDSTAYNDTRARLYNRKLDLAAAHFIRDFVWQHDLALDMRVARRMWQAIAPMMPTQSRDMPLVLEQLSEAPPQDIASEIVAQVDGTPFYARQFFNALPNLPRGYLGPNLKQAIEIAIRDSLLADEGISKQYHTLPAVVNKLKRAETAYVFNAMMQEALDTLRNTPRDLEQFYTSNRNRYLKHIETEVWEILVSSPDSARAIAKRIEAGLDFFAAARQYTLRDSVRDKNGYLGFIKSNENAIGKKASTLLPGALFAPVKTKDGFSVIRPGIRVPVYLPFAEVREDVARDVEQSLYTTAYLNLLPAGYNPNDVTYNTTLLSRAFSQSP